MYKIRGSKESFTQITIFLVVIVLLLLIDLFRVDVDYWLAAGMLVVLMKLTYNYPNFIIRYIMLFFIAIGNLVGVFICEHSNLWLVELGVRAGYQGSFPLLLAGWTIFIFVVWMLDKKYSLNTDIDVKEYIKIKFGKYSIDLYQILMMLGFIFAIVSFAKVVSNPAFLEHIDRFVYRERYITRPLEIMTNSIYAMLPILFMMIVKRIHNSWHWLIYSIIIFYFAYLFFIGEKFGGFWYVIVDGCIIFSLYAQKIPAERVRKWLWKLPKIFCILLLVIAIHRTLTYSVGVIDFVQNYLPQRVAQQGQLWWRTYALDKSNTIRIDELGDETRTFFQFNNNNKEYKHAIYKIMRFTTPNDIFQRKIASGSRYSTSTFASMFYYFKRVGVIILAIVGGCLFWGLMYLLMYAVSHLYILETVLAAKLLVNCYPVISMSEFNTLLQFKMLLYFIIVVGLIYIRKHMSNAGIGILK